MTILFWPASISYLACLTCVLLGKRLLALIVLLIFLLYLATGDHVFTYDLSNSYFPFFQGLSLITAEPSYLGLIAFIRELGFSAREILVIHSLLPSMIFILAMRLLFEGKKTLPSVMSLRSLINQYVLILFFSFSSILMFYISPRSGVSFSLSFLGCVLYYQSVCPHDEIHKAFRIVFAACGVMLLALGSSFHYQVLLFNFGFAVISSAFLLIHRFLPSLSPWGASYSGLRSSIPYFLIVALFGLGAWLLKGGAAGLASVFSLDTDYFAGKVSSSLSRSGGFRITSLATIVSFFIVYFKGRRLLGADLHVFFQICSSIAVAIVLAFFDNPHAAGRLARNSDLIVLPLSFAIVAVSVKPGLQRSMVVATYFALCVIGYQTLYFYSP